MYSTGKMWNLLSVKIAEGTREGDGLPRGSQGKGRAMHAELGRLPAVSHRSVSFYCILILKLFHGL